MIRDVPKGFFRATGDMTPEEARQWWNENGGEIGKKGLPATMRKNTPRSCSKCHKVYQPSEAAFKAYRFVCPACRRKIDAARPKRSRHGKNRRVFAPPEFGLRISA